MGASPIVTWNRLTADEQTVGKPHRNVVPPDGGKKSHKALQNASRHARFEMPVGRRDGLGYTR
ncbi:MAG: hypothetical protein ACK53L_18260, partial [Pirellulaceae bacterium]